MEFLKELNIQASNAGVSTGNEWLHSNGTSFPSNSPVDGKFIASVEGQ